MIKFNKSAFLVLFFLTTNAKAASTTDSSSIIGLPATASASTETAGELPYSTQWEVEGINSFLYLSYNTAQLANRNLIVGQYVSDYGGTRYAFPSIDYFSRLFSFAGTESTSFLRHFSLWGRYSLGFADLKANLSSTQTALNSSVESNSLILFSGRVGALLSLDFVSWAKPYVGYEIDPYFYRNTADISGAEQQGENFSYGPVLGLHLPIFFSGRASINTEYRHQIAAHGTGQLYAVSNNYLAGLGVSF